MSRFRVCFLGTPDFALSSLQALAQETRLQVVGVVSQPDRPRGRNQKVSPSAVKEWALLKGLPVLTPEKIRDSLEEIQQWKADVAVVVAYGQILPRAFLQLFPFGAVNVHASLLPRWRGASPIQRALQAGDPVTGVCLQKVVSELDAGDVLGVRQIEIPISMGARELHDLLAQKGCELLRSELLDYLQGHLAGVPQDPSRVTLAPKIQKNEGLISWEKSATEIHNLVRAFQMGPGTWTYLGEHKIKILRTQVETSSGPRTASEVGLFPCRKPGQCGVAEDRLFVSCGEGFLEILELQEESRNRKSAAEFLRSHQSLQGAFFSSTQVSVI